MGEMMTTVEVQLTGQRSDIGRVVDAMERVLSVTWGAESKGENAVSLALKVSPDELPIGVDQYDFSKHPNQPVLAELYQHINAALWLFNGLTMSGVMPETEWLSQLQQFHLLLGQYLDRQQED